MKNALLLIFLLSSHVVFGQFVAGTRMLQGSFNFQASFNGNDKDSLNHFNRHYISASIGAQIAKIESETQQWGFGGQLTLLNDVDKFTLKNSAVSNSNISRRTELAYSLNIFQTRLKKLLPNFYGGFRYYSSLGYAVSRTKSINEQTSILTQTASTVNSTSTSNNSITANVGITSQFYYFIKPNWGLSANIGYLDASFSHNFKAKSWSFNTYSGFGGVGFGLFKILKQ